MWYLRFFNPQKLSNYLGNLFETDKMDNCPEEGYKFVYTIGDDKNMSGVWIKCDENGYPILGIVPDNMDATAFIKYMFKNRTFCTDESVYEDAQYFENMSDDEKQVMWDYLFLSQMLSRNIITIDNEWAKTILAECITYMSIVDKYNLYFSPVNFFAPTKRALNEYINNLKK